MLADLAGNRRIFGFIAVLLGTTIGASALAVARVVFIGRSDLPPSTFGIVASLGLLGSAVVAFPAGAWVDRANPRHLLLLAMTLTGSINVLIGLLVLSGRLSAPLLIALQVIDMAAVMVQIPAILTTQAALVSPGARGSAQIISLTGAGLGAVVGSVVAGVVSDPALVFLGTGFLFVFTGFSAFVVSMPARFPPRVRASLRETVGLVAPRIRQTPGLPAVLVTDVVMRTLVPTTLVAVILLNLGAPQLASQMLAGGSAGYLLGNLALNVRGIHGRLRRRLLTCYSGYACALLLAAGLLHNGLSVDWPQPVILTFLVSAGTALSAYALGISSALVQQRSPDDIRGRLVGLLVIPTRALQAAAASLLVGAVAAGTAPIVLTGLAGAIIVAVLALRTFKPIDGLGQ